ncbi:MAG TPA: phage holin [Lactococcus sp.]|uniref:phage holin n=1 Tax=Lactococcus TaxID=1357 RepID=UPI000E92DAC7|nr:MULTISPECIES: phage holin [Lactococcus]HBC89937.1 phage holin [Lactococcus sp.]
MKNNISPGTIARTAILALALINQALTLAGHSIIPVNDGDIEQFVSLLFTVGAALAGWWKNNSFTQAALQADDYKKKLK